MKRVSLLSIVFFLLSFAGMTQNALPEYKVKKSVPVEGDGFWDYLIADSVRHRLFISHGTCVDVLDLKTMKKTGQIPGTTGVHGIALAYEFGKGFVSAGKLDTVIVFDLKTLKILEKVATGKILTPSCMMPSATGFSRSTAGATQSLPSMQKQTLLLAHCLFQASLKLL